jgi:hypothetical protein
MLHSTITLLLFGPLLLASQTLFAPTAKSGLTHPILQADDSAKQSTENPCTEELIDRLGSKRFIERAAAQKALEERGLFALEALRRASTATKDPEVRMRTTTLVSLIESKSLTTGPATRTSSNRTVRNTDCRRAR